MPSIEEICAERGMRMTEQRRTIARVVEAADDHPDTEELHRRAAAIDPGIAISTVYRTLALFEDAGIVARHAFLTPDHMGGRAPGEPRARYETVPDDHHDHLIDLKSGAVIEFRDEEIEALQELVAERLGYRLVDHRLELYAVPLDTSSSDTDDA